MASSVQPNVVVNENLNRTMAKIKCEVEEDFHLYPSNNDRHPAAAALGAYSMKNAPFGNSNEPLDCVVCGDRATGKHYGAISCDGCKGFFRRSVRKNPVYECRHHNNCTIDKDKRNQCRHCRLKKCIRMGMKKEAVQKERDRLGRQRNSHHHHHPHPHPHPPHPSPSANSSGPHLTIDLDEEEDDDLSVTTLLKAEKTAQDFIGRQIRLDRQTSPKERLQATLETICISMNYQLRSLIEWAKGLKSFVELTDNDKIALLRGHTSENLILGLACRSLNCDDYLLLGNHYIIPRNTSDPALACMAGRILDEIVKPLKENQVDEKEYACLKAIVFFDNDNKSLSDPVRVKAIRKHIQVNLETYINQQRPLTRGRFGELLLLLPPLQNISRLLVDLVARYNHDSQHVDDLINEMLLNRYLDDREESGISTTNRSNHNTTTSSPSDSVSKENDLDSNASSIDTDMEDNHGEDVLIATPQYDPLASGAPIPDSVLIGSSNVDADLEDITLNGNDDYLADNLAHIQLLQAPVNGDPHFGNRTAAANEANGHRSQPSVIHYFADTAASNQLKSSVSKPISTPSPTNSSVGTSFDMNQDMAFLCDLITPPTTSALRSSLSVQSNPNFFDDQWNT